MPVNRSRRVLPAVLAALLLGPLSTWSPAGAEDARAGEPRLTRSDFPSVGEVARHYPYYRGGSLDLFRPSRARVDLPTADCVGYEPSRVRVRTSRVADYVMRDGELAYFHGLSDPTVAVYVFGSARAAARSLRELRAALEVCAGRHGDDEYAVTYRRVPMPRLGGLDDRLAYRRTTDQAGLGLDYSAEAWVRRGRVLVDARVQRDPSAPALRPLFGLTRAALAAAS